MRLTEPLHRAGEAISGRDLILLVGGLFIGKSTHEIHQSLRGCRRGRCGEQDRGLPSTLVQIAILDIIFSLTRHHRRGHERIMSLSWCWPSSSPSAS
jgi:predicted tellurium resistance membrane protein TerC